MVSPEIRSGLRIRRRFTPAQRDPFFLPEDPIGVPSPPRTAGSPPKLNLLTTLLPSALMFGGSLLVPLLTGTNNLTMMLPMLAMGLGLPVASIVGYNNQKKEYEKSLADREAAYRKTLEQKRIQLRQAGERQRGVLEGVYPVLEKIKRSAKTQDRLLWSRRPHDEDFLSLRLGTGSGVPSFKIETESNTDSDDPLAVLGSKLAAEFRELPRLPRLIPLGPSGSIAVNGRDPAVVCGAVRRLVLDIIVHHSPQDVFLFVLGDTPEAGERWEWLKWAPHTDALGADKNVRRLVYTQPALEKTLEFLSKELRERAKKDGGGADAKKGRKPALVVLVDDAGRIRQREDVIELTESGADAGIHLIFAGGRAWPRECKSRIDLLDGERYKFVETWTKERTGHEGVYETASTADCEAAARALAGLEAASSQTGVPLPGKIRLSEVIGAEEFSAEAVRSNWEAPMEPQDMLQFPIGVRARRDRLEAEIINLLPAERGGSDSYHTILIGTTGSGKSEFMKSLVMGAAHRYSPVHLNLFFMDFKGGAAFSVFETLPHVSGIVTNLKPELVERGLDSITNEIERRQAEFADAKVQNIWDYNRNPPGAPMPHLVLFLDEFARGLADFPRLREPLDVLVRQGRSLGMYLILANQDVNSEVDKLLNNVGWRIALKVAKADEMQIIDRKLPIAARAGHGYLRALSGAVSEFQAGYGGFPVRTEEETDAEGFSIYQVEADGSYREVFKKQAGEPAGKKRGDGSAPREEEELVRILRQAAEEMHLKPASKIYLDPIEETIPLEKNMADTGVRPKYADGVWQTDPPPTRLIAAAGELDLPKQCRQEQLAIDFDERDGHLWLIGGPGSGRDASLVAILMSLALTYTPGEVQFYLIEMGAGDLMPLEGLPHTGLCTRLQPGEKERLDRLLNFLDAEMDRRIAEAAKSDSDSFRPLPAIFLAINNCAEFRANFPDEADRVSRYVRDGKAAGIHLVAATNRSAELMRTAANNIARRLVLQLSSRDEYYDAVGKSVPALQVKAPGRGYWVDGGAWECQIAQPPQQLRELIRGMNSAWKGGSPKRIEMLRPAVGLAELLDRLETVPGGPLRVPVGQAYDTLEWVTPDAADLLPCWMILGPKESGKSNFLCCVARAALKCDPEHTLVKAYAFRRSPLAALARQDPRIRFFGTPDEIQKDCQDMAEAVKSGRPIAEGRRVLWLVDDLSYAFQTGKEALLAPFNTIAQGIDGVTDLFIFGAGLMDEFRMAMASPMLKIMRQSRQGMVLSKDSNELDWLGAQIGLGFRKLELPAGRGFYVSKGKPTFVQTPLCEIQTAG